MKRSGLIKRRTPLKRGKPPKRSTKRIKRGKPPRRVSEKRARQLVAYQEVRLIVLARDGGCVLFKLNPDLCAELSIGWTAGRKLECEHTEGRWGKRLTDADKCVALHPYCHRYVTDHAKKMKPILRAYLATLETVAIPSVNVATAESDRSVPRFTA